MKKLNKLLILIPIVILMIFCSCDEKITEPIVDPIEPVTPGVPTLTSPANNAIDIATDSILTWEEADNALTYTVNISLDPNFHSTAILVSSITETHYYLPNLPGNIIYYWRIRANHLQRSSNWSSGWTFKTKSSSQTMDGVGKLSLVPLEFSVSGCVVGDNGQQYISVDELIQNGLVNYENGHLQPSPLTLNKITNEIQINFSEILATKTLMYVLMNTGTKNVFNIEFSSDLLEISPSTIGLLEVNTEGTSISSLPIVSFTIPHVIPPAGVGSLLAMEVGEISDTLSLSYSYQQTIDTITVVDNYNVAGTKMGAIIDILISGIPIEEYTFTTDLFCPIGYSEEFLGLCCFTTSELDTIVINNNGNVSLRMRILSENPTATVLDTTILPGAEIDVSGKIRSGSSSNFFTPGSSGQMLLLGDTRDQLYIFSVYSEYCIDGFMGLYIM